MYDEDAEKLYDDPTTKFAQEEENKLEEKLEKCRCYEGDAKERNKGREEFSRDYARVLYSSSFRRLQGKMQLLGIHANHFNRNRLTHSLEVAQIARTIAKNLGIRETIVSETCALCHDIGNPPFGHYGENILNELSQDIGGYEGNAQTFRILRSLEKKHHLYNGLNLTYRTMFGVVKYFFKKSENNKKFLYDDDYDFLEGILKKKNVSIRKSIDAQIMDLADEIAYAAHDLEDALSFRMISIGELLHEFKISKKYESAYDALEEITKKAHEAAMHSHLLNTSEEYFSVLKKELTGNIVYKLCCDIGVDLQKRMLVYKEQEKLAEGLKKLLFNTILRKTDIQLYEKRGEKVIRGLFEVYTDKTYNKDMKLLPPELRAIYNTNNNCQVRQRVVIDYISGMMDSFAIHEYEKYFGKGSSDSLYFKLEG